MNFATWTNRVINESSEQYFAEELMEESIAKTLKPVVNKMKKLEIGVPYRDSRLFFYDYLKDRHPELIPSEYANSNRKPSAKDVNAMVGQIAIEKPEMLDKFAEEFDNYATEKVEGTDEDRVSEFLRIAMILRTGKGVRPKKDVGYAKKEYSNLTSDKIKDATMDAIEKVPVDKGDDVDIKDEKLVLKIAFTNVLAQLQNLEELNPEVLEQIIKVGKTIDTVAGFKKFLDYMHQYEEYHEAEAYLRAMVKVLEQEVPSIEDNEGKYDDKDGKDEKCDHVPCEDAENGCACDDCPDCKSNKKEEDNQSYVSSYMPQVPAYNKREEDEQIALNPHEVARQMAEDRATARQNRYHQERRHQDGY